MSTDALTRLRAADPCPTAAGYDDTVAQHNIDTIVRTDLVVRPAPVRRSRRRRVWPALVAAMVGVLVVVAVVSVRVSRDDVTRQAADDAWTTFSGSGISFDHPVAWTSYPADVVATMFTAVAYLSTVPFGVVCTTASSADGTVETACHPPRPDLSQGGTLVDWTVQSTPGLTPERYSGEATVVAGRPARRDDSTLPEECRPTGAVAGVQVAVDVGDSNVLTMTACIGPGDVATERAAVDRMLASFSLATRPSS